VGFAREDIWFEPFPKLSHDPNIGFDHFGILHRPDVVGGKEAMWRQC